MISSSKHKILTYGLTLTILIALALSTFGLAAVWTDQDDYSPGSVVTISGDNSDGAGYLPGETVQVEVSGPNGYTAACEGVADADGAWSCQVTLWDSLDAVGDYAYTATGLTSGVSQSGTFTDGGATVSGYVKDVSGNPISGATVKCISGCNQQDSTTTNTSGYYSLTFQFSGNSNTVTLEASKPGYSSANVQLSVANGKTYTQDFTLSSACTPPLISVHPASQTKTVGELVTFSVTASGTAPLSYQWRKGGSNVGTNNPSYTINSVVVADAGSYDVVVSNACGSATSNAATLTVNKATATVTLSNLTQTYTGSPLYPTATTNPSGLAIVWTNAPQTNAGNYSVTATVNDPNYQGSASGTFVISKADATCSISGYTGVYDGDPHGASGSCVGVKGETLAGLDLGDSFTNVPGGTANWTFTDETGNYNDASGSAAIVISKADAVCTVTGWSGVYDGDPHGASGSCLGVKGETLAGLDLGASFTNVPGGTANWTFTDETGNYNDASGSVAIVITKRPVTVTADDQTKVYGEADPELTYQITSGSLVPGDSFHGELARVAGEDVGSYAIYLGTLELSSNYNLSFIGANLTITKATLTVTADNQSIVFGQPLPVFTFQYSGFKFSDGPSVINTQPTCSVGAIPSYGNYTIVCSGGADNNYDFTYVNGILTVQAWNLLGFYQPVDMPTPTKLVYNTVKNGSTVPLKFEIFAGATELTEVSAVKSLTYAQTSCDANALTDEIETVATGGTVLRYADGQFIFNWKTPNTANKCYRVTMTALDGSKLEAYFRLK